MQVSLSADRAWQRWIGSSWTSWVDRGCPGGTPQGSNRAELNAFSIEATRVKSRFVNRYDPIAASQGLRSSWTAADI
jgi:hypothetical protein